MRGREEGTEGQRGGRGWKKGDGYVDNFLWSFSNYNTYMYHLEY